MGYILLLFVARDQLIQLGGVYRIAVLIGQQQFQRNTDALIGFMLFIFLRRRPIFRDEKNYLIISAGDALVMLGKLFVGWPGGPVIWCGLYDVDFRFWSVLALHCVVPAWKRAAPGAI